MKPPSVLLVVATSCVFIFSLIATEANISYFSFHKVQAVSDTDLYGMIYSSKKGMFIAVGDGGYIGNSLDGVTWQASISKTDADLRAIAYRYSASSSDTYVAVGTGGTVVVSNDGIWWSEVGRVTTKTLKAVANRSSTFVAVGQEGVVIRSEGAKQWEALNPIVSVDLNGITYGNGLFVAVGNNGVIILSEDSKNWRQVRSPVNSHLRAVAFGNGSFVAVGDGGVVLRSIDGEQWTQQDSRTGSYLKAVTFGDPIFFAVGQGGTVMYSPDGITWQQIYTGINLTLNSVLFKNNIFVASSYGGNIVNLKNSYLVANPSTINFGTVDPGRVLTQSFAVINTGDTPLEISSVSKSGDEQFTITNDLCTGITLQRSGSCRVDVRFSPGLAGLNKASIIVKSSNIPIATTISLLATSTGVLNTLTVTRQGNGNVYSSPDGINCGNTCTATFIGGTTFRLFAIPQTGASFMQWTGLPGCTTNNPCTFTLDSDVAVTAVFQ